MEVIRLFAKFVSDTYRADTTDRLWDAWLDLLEPMCPKEIWRTGDTVFPPSPSRNGVTLILSNHICDMDIVLINKWMSKHRNSGTPVKLAGFTYELFRYIPWLGTIVGRMLIGLKKGESIDALKAKIRFCLDQGYNTFLLFPEGSLFHTDSYETSLEWQRKQNVVTLLHEVLYPRYGALDAFLEVVQDRLECVVDITLQYQDLDPRKANWSYTDYPAAIYSLFCHVPPPLLHARNIPVKDWKKIRDHSWLLKLWRRKNERIRLVAQSVDRLLPEPGQEGDQKNRQQEKEETGNQPLERHDLRCKHGKKISSAIPHHEDAKIKSKTLFS